ncbi:Eukaryotic peptide chain release factor GTP-binding subunit [Lithohypha guttulata]|uniref:Eukaryotic peptide chain release factor GTP-binding subunit n=1 Tax=Lithohypha guttulata TaxID=1690604 RepID=A0AAN7YLS6_9EURO|nr:Eukaryotic peptide chain release factor GTP-binding subunit [Lithohypha guttulata]
MTHKHRATNSVTTAYTESEVPNDYDANSHQAQSEADHEYFRSHSPEKKSIPAPLNLGHNLGVGNQKEKPLHSPASFRSGFSIGSKQIIPPTHQQLRSIDNSPRYDGRMHDLQQKHLAAQQSAMGKNYEYFEGNNVFWLGGRLQNARDRPVNILTGILILFPTILFFIFS